MIWGENPLFSETPKYQHHFQKQVLEPNEYTLQATWEEYHPASVAPLPWGWASVSTVKAPLPENVWIRFPHRWSNCSWKNARWCPSTLHLWPNHGAPTKRLMPTTVDSREEKHWLRYTDLEWLYKLGPTTRKSLSNRRSDVMQYHVIPSRWQET